MATYRRAPRADLLAGLVVAVVAVPLALAFGESSGLGAGAGLTTAVVAGAIAAVSGGSDLQVSGPTGAMTVVLLPIMHRYGAAGVLTSGLLAGGILIALAAARLGRYVRFIPAPVIEGFTAGIAVVITMQQIPAALGVPGTGDKAWAIAATAVAHDAHHFHPAAILTALAVAAFILAGTARWPSVPFSLIAVAAATVVAELAPLQLTRIGHLPHGLPAPSLAFLDPRTIPHLLPSAIAIAALAALESLLCATAADAMRRPPAGGPAERHDPDRELFGQGLANLAAPLFGGVPATAAIARTAVNVRSGARSRLAALTHAAVLGVVLVAAGGLVAQIPLAALAGVLLATTARMIKIGTLRAVARSTRTDGLVLLLTFAVTVTFDLVTAVVAGVALAAALTLRSVSRTSRLRALRRTPGDVLSYRLEGPLFFADAHRLADELTSRLSDTPTLGPPGTNAAGGVRHVVLCMSRVTTLDATGAHALAEALAELRRRGVTVLLSRVHPAHQRTLRTLGIDLPLFPDTPSALAHARDLTTGITTGPAIANPRPA